MIERALAFYKRWLSPALHAMSGVSGACRFHPSCSEYAAAALEQHGVVLGSGLAIWRLLRCNPFNRGGFDPVPGTYVPAAPLAETGIAKPAVAEAGECLSESLARSPARQKRFPFPLRRG
jgi:uncharacterized protein